MKIQPTKLEDIEKLREIKNSHEYKAARQFIKYNIYLSSSYSEIYNLIKHNPNDIYDFQNSIHKNAPLIEIIYFMLTKFDYIEIGPYFLYKLIYNYLNKKILSSIYIYEYKYELNICLELIYLYYKDIYMILNTCLFQYLNNLTLYNYRLIFNLIEYLYTNNKLYTFNKLYLFLILFPGTIVIIPGYVYSEGTGVYGLNYNTKILNYNDVFYLIKDKSTKYDYRYKNIIDTLTNLNTIIRYGQTCDMSDNRIIWIRLVAFISNR